MSGTGWLVRGIQVAKALLVVGDSPVVPSVRLHGASPWHLEFEGGDSACSREREAPRGKPVASWIWEWLSSCSSERETPRGKPVAS